VISICNLAYIVCIILVIILLFEYKKYLSVDRALKIVTDAKLRKKQLDDSRRRLFGSERDIDTIPPEPPRHQRGRRRFKRGYKPSDRLPPSYLREEPPLPPPPPPDEYDDYEDDDVYY
jgi:hypothetical protein